MCDAVIIGAAIADVLLRPVDDTVFSVGSLGVDSIRMSVGGDALNESTVLARLGHAPLLATKLGVDGAADFVLAHCAREGVKVHAARDAQMDTGINAVLVGHDGERSFITNKNGSLRRLALEDVLPVFDTDDFARAKVVCLASMFVSPMLGNSDMEALLGRAKAAGKIVCADTTKRKNGETVQDVAGVLRHVDYFFPNAEEAKLLTDKDTPDEIADALLDAGVGCVALKLGGQGCLLKTKSQRICVPAYPYAQCVDTTGAGDNFAAAFIAGLLEGKDLAQCGAQANAVASICVEKLGATAAVPERGEVERRVNEILSGM